MLWQYFRLIWSHQVYFDLTRFCQNTNHGLTKVARHVLKHSKKLVRCKYMYREAIVRFYQCLPSCKDFSNSW